MPPALHITGFPHIIEAIVSYASMSTLLQLRLTCHKIKGYIDAQLFNHIALSWCDSFTDEIQEPTPPYNHLPCLPFLFPPGPLPSPVLKSTTIIDYFGLDRYPDFQNLKIVRHRTAFPPYVVHSPALLPPPPTHTLVEYLDLGECAWRVIKVPPVSRWIFHVICHSIYQVNAMTIDVSTTGQLDELVLVFTYSPKSSPREAGEHMKPTNHLFPAYLDLTYNFKTVSVQAARTGTTTYVGLESLPPQALGIPANTSPSRVLKRIRNSLKTEVQRQIDMGLMGTARSDDTLRQVMRNIKFQTFNEWVESLSQKDKIISEMPTFTPYRWRRRPGDAEDESCDPPCFSDDDSFSDTSGDDNPLLDPEGNIVNPIFSGDGMTGSSDDTESDY